MGEGLACRRGERLLFEGVSLAAPAGALLEIVGPNGSGKTSLLRVLAGLLKPEAGFVSFVAGTQALDPDEHPPGDLLHYASHQDALKSQLTARENLRFAAAYFGAPDVVGEALERLGLSVQADLPVAYFSAGQRRRLALARCWMLRRPVWLLDEPTAALDTAGRALVAELIAGHLGQGGTVVAATHEPILTDATRLAIA